MWPLDCGETRLQDKPPRGFVMPFALLGVLVVLNLAYGRFNFWLYQAKALQAQSMGLQKMAFYMDPKHAPATDPRGTKGGKGPPKPLKWQQQKRQAKDFTLSYSTTAKAPLPHWKKPTIIQVQGPDYQFQIKTLKQN